MNKMLFGIIVLSCLSFIQIIKSQDSLVLTETYPSSSDENIRNSFKNRFPWKKRDSDCDDDNSYDDDEYFD